MKLKVFAIEFTNHCNAKCSFCPYPTPEHTRTKGFMSRETLGRIMEVCEPGRINISGLGEPLIHPLCAQYIRLLAEAGFTIQVNTNGKLLTQEKYMELAFNRTHNIVITADYFKWTKEGINEVPECPITMLTITREPDRPELGQLRKPLDDWGGQVGKVERPRVECSYIYGSFVDIAWDGTIKRCHVDFNCNHPFGNIHSWDETRTYYGEGIPLCSGCSGYKFADGIVSGSYDGQTPNLVELKV